MKPTAPLRLLAAALLGLAAATATAADEATVAVAANFTATANALEAKFAAATGHHITFSFGSSGKLYTQIENGAPFDALLSADAERPKRAEESGLGVAGSRFTYAQGKLVLWSAKADGLAAKGEAALKGGAFEHLALANPKTAPYGAAAEQYLAKAGLLEGLRPKLVQGENIAQTLQFVVSGNAQLGFVALAQVQALKPEERGASWEVPAASYAPIVQDAVLLKHGAGNPAARAFLDYLKTAEAKEMIRAAGYGVE